MTNISSIGFDGHNCVTKSNIFTQAEDTFKEIISSLQGLVLTGRVVFFL